MKRLLLTIAFIAAVSGIARAQVQQLVNFDNTSNLTTLFNPDSSPEFTNISDQGIGNTGSINVPLGSQDIWTTKAGYSVSGEGDVYTLSAFFKIKENGGYGGLGFSPDDTNEPDPYGSPVFGLGMAFHGGGGMFVNNQELTDVSWPPDLVIGNWYKMILKVTAMGSNTYNMDFQIWNSDANGTLGTMKTEQTLNGVVNTQVGGASTLHVYFSAAGSRMEKIDNFYIDLEGGAVIVEPGAPVVITEAVSAVTTSAATCGGNVTDDQGSAVTARGVCWSTTTGPTIALSTKTSDGTGNGTFVSSITGLAASTTYYVRAYATNGVGTSYGAEQTFATNGFTTATVPAGSGTSVDPYKIASLANLLWMSQNSSAWGAYYRQTADIDASETSEWNGGQGWIPIGNLGTDFAGSYDGQGHIISGLYLNRLSNWVGLFGVVSDGRISNLGVINVDITGNSNVGGLVGQASNVSNCYTTGTVKGHQYTGGLAGQGSNVSNCHSSCTVSGSSASGGLLGTGSDIENCYSTGNVIRIVGSGYDDFGGFIGWGFGTIQYCYSTGSVSYTGGSSPSTNGFVGSDHSASYTANFFDQTTSAQTSGIGATAELTSAMQTQSTFTGWDFAGTWGISGGYPYLLFRQIAPEAGNGSSGSPYQIANINNLFWLSQQQGKSDGTGLYWSRSYVQAVDIDASASSGWDGGAGWTPIGNATTNFTGTYDGGSHTISGLRINRSASTSQGFIGYTETGAVVKNVGLTNVNIAGLYWVGGLIGMCVNSSVSNCYSTGTVNGDHDVAGFAGRTHLISGGISNCYSTASVSATGTNSYAGGFVGYDNAGTITCCYSTGFVTGTNYAGGFSGYGGGTITFCFWDNETSGWLTSGSGFEQGKTTAQMKTNSTFLSAGWDYAVWNIGDGINNGYPYLKWQNPGGTPLPIQLASFTGRSNPNGQGTLLEWTTLSEINNYGFEIQRGGDSTSYQSIPGTLIPGHGTTNQPQHYSYVDSVATAGAWYYRLKQIDLDGSVHYSDGIHINGVTDVKEPEVPTVFSLAQNYPNPFNPSSTIRYGLPHNAFVTLTVYNALGQQVAQLVNEQQQAGYHNVVFRAQVLASGMYLYRIQAGNFSSVKKLMLLK